MPGRGSIALTRAGWCSWSSGKLRACRAVRQFRHSRPSKIATAPRVSETIAIAYEEGWFGERIRKVQNVRDRLGINYRLLLGGEVGSCPVRIQFGVNAFPTLVLLDEHNRIIWRHQGLDSYKLQRLQDASSSNKPVATQIPPVRPRARFTTNNKEHKDTPRAFVLSSLLCAPCGEPNGRTSVAAPPAHLPVSFQVI